MPNGRVKVIYTGGTLGSRARDAGDPESPQIVVPWSDVHMGMREIDSLGLDIDVAEIDPPLDSCNVGPREWLQMVELIAADTSYDGWVIAHGTDTMTATGTALSFLCLDLGKPVILTGAQRSALVSPRNDAGQNLITALELAGAATSGRPVIPEVCIVFGGQILRANRCIKYDTNGLQAYVSPNYPALGEVGDDIVVHRDRLLPPPVRPPEFQRRIEGLVMPVWVSPGVQETDLIQRVLEIPGLKGAVVVAFGSGNVPTAPSVMSAIRSATDRGVVVAIASQCARGPVELGIYETSAALLEAGCVAANDATAQTAIIKLMTLLSNPDLDVDEVRRRFQRSLAGEQRLSQFVTVYPGGGMVDDASPRVRAPARPVPGVWNPERIVRATVRLYGAQVRGDEVDPKHFSCFLNLGPDSEPSAEARGFAGRFKKYAMAEPAMVFFDVTRAFRASIGAGMDVSWTLLQDSAGSELSWTHADLVIFSED